ncbi:MAG: hypothetical protein NTX03_12770 [Bacteroidetes bacterium]|nr:hypothetical protein [Bacteroidota bacterium]
MGSYVGIWVYDKQTIEFDDFSVKELTSTSSYNSGSNSNGSNAAAPSSPSGSNNENTTRTNTTVDKSTGNFTTDLKTIIASGSQNFADIKGDEIDPTAKYFKDYYSSVKLPGAMETKISNILGLTHYTYFGPYSSQSAAFSKVEEMVGKLKGILTDHYYTKVPNSTEIQYSIGKNASGGYEKKYISVYDFKDSKTGEYKVVLAVYAYSSYKQPRYYFISSSADNGSDFGGKLNKVIRAGADSFISLRGEKHKGWLSDYYDPTLTLPGGENAKLSKFIYHSYDCTFYDGTSEYEANSKYNELIEKVKRAVGSNFVYKDEYDDGKGSKTYTYSLSMKADQKTFANYPDVKIMRSFSSSSNKYEVKISVSKSFDW